MGGGGHDHTLEPPLYRLPLPNRALPEEDELIWNDRVAPETALDLDAPHISPLEGLVLWLGGFAFFYSVYLYAASTDHPSNKPTVRALLFHPPSARARARVRGLARLPRAGRPRPGGDSLSTRSWFLREGFPLASLPRPRSGARPVPSPFRPCARSALTHPHTRTLAPTRPAPSAPTPCRTRAASWTRRALQWPWAATPRGATRNRRAHFP